MARRSLVQEIKDFRSGLERYYNNMRIQMQNEHRIFKREYGRDVVRVPKGVPIHIPSTAPALIRVARDQIHVESAQASVDSLGDSARAIERQEKIQLLHQTNILNLQTRGKVNVPRQASGDMFIRGAACAKVMFDEDAWPDIPDQEEGESAEDYKERLSQAEAMRSTSWPYIVRPIDPLNVLPDPSERWPMDFCLEAQKRRVIDMKTHYPHWRDPLRQSFPVGDNRRDDPMREVEWVEYWTKDRYVVLADGDPVIDKANPYGIVPYVFCYSGLGREDASGDPAELAIGLLHDAIDELKAEVRVKTALDAAWQFGVFPRLLTTEDAREVKRRWDFGAGGIVQVASLAPDQKPQWMETPPLNPAMFNFLGVLETSIRRATFSPALQGERSPGVDYGYLQALLIGQSRQMLTPVVESLQVFTARLLSLLALMQEKVVAHKTTVYVTTDDAERAVTITPRDIGGYYRVRVRMETVDPRDNDRRILTGLQALRAGTLSRRRYMKEYLGIDDPTSEDVRIRADQVLDQLIRSGFLADAVVGAEQLIAQQAQIAEGVTNVKRQLAGEPGRAGPVNPMAAPLMTRRLQRGQPGQGPPLGSPRGDTGA